MKQKKRVAKLAARQKDFGTIKQTKGGDNAFHKPGSMKK